MAQVVALLRNQNISESSYKVGKTKIFLKEESIHDLDLRVTLKQTACATKIQSWYRRHIIRQKYLTVLASVLLIQKRVRGRCARTAFQQKRRAIITIQAWVRGWFARDYRKQLESAAAQRKTMLHVLPEPTQTLDASDVRLSADSIPSAGSAHSIESTSLDSIPISASMAKDMKRMTLIGEESSSSMITFIDFPRKCQIKEGLYLY